MEDQFSNEMAAILDGFRNSYTLLSAFVEAIPDQAYTERRGEGCWTIAEHVAHLAEVQPMGLQRIVRMLEEDTPEFVPFQPSDEVATVGPMPTRQQALADFKAGRDAMIARLETATPEDWRRTAIHPEYRQYGLRIFARHVLMHDQWHMYRMEELWVLRDTYLFPAKG